MLHEGDEVELIDHIQVTTAANERVERVAYPRGERLTVTHAGAARCWCRDAKGRRGHFPAEFLRRVPVTGGAA
jgi:hypothetical protein